MQENKSDFHLEEWPKNELEYIDLCPVCKSERRKILHKDVVDNVFNCAPGKWTLYECQNCKSAYLNPRPKSDSIYKAYEDYYTHTTSKRSDEYEQLTFLAKIKRMMANGYRNWRYGGQLYPASRLGIFIVYLFPWLRLEIDQLHRHLPKLTDKGGRVLDVGFGNGSFLDRAIAIGWDAVGVDFDKEVVESAKKRNLNVYLGGIELLEEKEEYFDVITLNHVIEHLYNPMEVLQVCYKLLKPDGILWLETPNILSYGHDIYAKNWRGIETPRHLVIFNSHSLLFALNKVGFEDISMEKRQSPLKNMFFQSERLRGLRKNNMNSIEIYIFNFKVMVFRFLTIMFSNKKEFITIQCKKPRI